MRKRFKYALCFITVLSMLLPVMCLGTFAVGDFNISTMHPLLDNNSFKNTAADFIGENERSKYYLSAAELNALTKSESEDTKNLIISQALSKFDGADYGIAATMALSYVGEYDLPASNYYSVDIKKNTAFRNRINYYHLTQYCMNKAAAETVVFESGKTYEDPLKQVVEYAKSGKPFLINFRLGLLAHSAVACGYEYDTEFHRVRMLDCNKTDDFVYLLISPDYTEWSFENYEDYNFEDVDYFSFSTLDVFLGLKPETENGVIYSAVAGSQDIDTVCTDMSSSFTLTNGDGKTLTFDRGEITGEFDAEIVKFISTSGFEEKTRLIFTVPDSNVYTVKNNGEELNLTVVGDNGLFFSVQGKNISSVTASEGQTTIEGENIEYSVSTLSTEDKTDMINVCGADPEKVTFSVKDGMTVSNADNGKIHVSLISKGKLYENDFTIEHGKKSIHFSDVEKTNYVTGKGSPIMKRVILAFLALVFVITLAFTIKKYTAPENKGKKDETKNG